MRKSDPAAVADLLQPCVIGCIVRKVITMSFDCQSTGPQNLGETLAEIAIGKIDRQAARS
jgi:hypothetical protein